MRQEDVSLAKINVGDRFREDYGDLVELATSISQKGVLQPVTLDEDYNLLAGGRRYRAAEIAGLATIPALIRHTEGVVDALEVELIENVYRKDLTWQERAKLEARIYELKGTQRGAAEATGQAVGTVNRHIQLARAIQAVPALAECKSEDEAFKAMRKIEEQILVRELLKRQQAQQKETGVVARWDFAKNHYLIGDAIEGLAALQPATWNFAEVDPPYGIDLTAQKRRDGVGMHGLKKYERYQEIEKDDYGAFLLMVAEQVFRVLVPNSFCIWWFGPTHYSLVKSTLEVIGFQINDIPAIWYKGNQGQTNQPNMNLANCYEMFFVARKGSPSLHRQGRSNVFQYDPVPAARKIHPTERPIELMKELLSTFMWPSMRVVSPFLGSGSVLRAAYQLGTFGLGWDLAQEHKDKFLLRVEEDSKEGKHEGSASATPIASDDS